jgi:hypothetical protein
MKAQLTFDLDDYDDSIAHLRCIQSSDICMVLWNFMNNTREEVTEKALKDELDIDNAVNSAYHKLWEMLDEKSINIDKLVD